METTVIRKAGEFVQIPGIGNGEWAFEVEHVVLKFTEKNAVEAVVFLNDNSEQA